MNKNMLAFILSSLTVTVLFSSLSLFHPNLNQRAVQVEIRADGDTHDIVEAVEALHRQDVDIRTEKSLRTGTFTLTMLPAMVLGLLLMTGLNLIFYKLYCRWLEVPPTI
jgi:hypothetical protein